MSKRKLLPSNAGVLKVDNNTNGQENCPEPKFKKTTRNPNFDCTETAHLISIWGHPKIQNDLKHSSKRSAALQEVSDKLHKLGYKRSMVEINTRIKNIKCMYNRMRKDIELGLLREPTWKHYDAIDQVLRLNEITTEQSLHSSIPDSALMETIGETRESLEAAANDGFPEGVQVKTEPMDEEDLLVPMTTMDEVSQSPDTSKNDSNFNNPNEMGLGKSPCSLRTTVNSTKSAKDSQQEVKKEPVHRRLQDLPMLTKMKEKPEVEILRIPSRKSNNDPQKSPFPPELVSQQKFGEPGGPKFIILRHQSGNNYLQPVSNNVISLNPGLKIRPISELSSKAQTQSSQMMPTPVPQSVLKLLKEQQNMSEPPQLASLSSNAPQFSPKSILKPKEMPNISKATQCSPMESVCTSTSNEDSLEQKKPSIQSLLHKIIEIEHNRLEIEKNRLDFEKKIGTEIVTMLKKLTDS